MVKANALTKLMIVALIMLTYKRNGELNCQKTFDFFSSYITAFNNSFKLIEIYIDTVSGEHFLSH